MTLRLVAEHGELIDDEGEFSEEQAELAVPAPLRAGDGFEPVPGIPAF